MTVHAGATQKTVTVHFDPEYGFKRYVREVKRTCADLLGALWSAQEDPPVPALSLTYLSNVGQDAES